MKILPIALIALLAAGTPPHQETNSWRQDGVPILDRPNMKSKNGFGAQLLLTEDAQFFEDWEKPETPFLEPLKKAKRNVPLFTAILFVDPGLDNSGHADVTCDITVRKPDGSVYGQEIGVTGWQGAYSVPPHNLQLSEGRIGIRIEPQDPPGTYTVEVVVHDRIRHISLPLKTTFEVPQ